MPLTALMAVTHKGKDIEPDEAEQMPRLQNIDSA